MPARQCRAAAQPTSQHSGRVACPWTSPVVRVRAADQHRAEPRAASPQPSRAASQSEAKSCGSGKLIGSFDEVVNTDARTALRHHDAADLVPARTQFRGSAVQRQTPAAPEYAKRRHALTTLEHTENGRGLAHACSLFLFARRSAS